MLLLLSTTEATVGMCSHHITVQEREALWLDMKNTIRHVHPRTMKWISPRMCVHLKTILERQVLLTGQGMEMAM